MSNATKQKPSNLTLLGKGDSLDMNVTTAQAILISSAKYVIRKIIVTDASISLTTAVGGVFAEVGASTALVGAGQAYSALTAAGKFVDLTLATAATQNVRTETAIYLKLATPQGAAATANFFIFGDKLD